MVLLSFVLKIIQQNICICSKSSRHDTQAVASDGVQALRGCTACMAEPSVSGAAGLRGDSNSYCPHFGLLALL